MLDAVCVVDRDGRFLFVSAAFEQLFGYAPADIIGKPMVDLVFVEDRDKTLKTVDALLAGELKPVFENRWVHKSGRIVHVMWSARWSEEYQVRVAVARDITEQKHQQSKQAALYAISEAAYAAADSSKLLQRVHLIIGEWFPSMNFFVALYDKEAGRLTFPYVAVAFDRNADDCKAIAEALVALVLHSGQPQLQSSTATLETIAAPLLVHHQAIGALVVQGSAVAMPYTQKHVELLQFVATQVATVMQRQEMEAQLQHMARHDPLTDLPNRALFQDRLHIALAHARRNKTQLCLLFIDLDGFKQINDRFGHLVGDRLLQKVANRLRSCIRESDTVARMGGDEFVVLTHGMHCAEDAVQIAEKIRAAIAQPYDITGLQVHISLSIGIALYPQHGDDYQQLLKNADNAMYRAKNSGGDSLMLFDVPEQTDETDAD